MSKSFGLLLLINLTFLFGITSISAKQKVWTLKNGIVAEVEFLLIWQFQIDAFIFCCIGATYCNWVIDTLNVLKYIILDIFDHISSVQLYFYKNLRNLEPPISSASTTKIGRYHQKLGLVRVFIEHVFMMVEHQLGLKISLAAWVNIFSKTVRKFGQNESNWQSWKSKLWFQGHFRVKTRMIIFVIFRKKII